LKTVIVNIQSNSRSKIEACPEVTVAAQVSNCGLLAAQILSTPTAASATVKTFTAFVQFHFTKRNQ
jgi:hypothetical protein